MIVKEYISIQDYKFKKSNLKFAVIGHIEWINFIKVDQLPKSGLISHASKSLEYPAGGGSVIAKRLRELTNSEVHFFTSLGNDFYGKQSYTILKEMGLNLHVAWREKSTRKGFSLIDNSGERSITVIGERLEPHITDKLNWNILKEMDGVFITAGDINLLIEARQAKVLCLTPRFGMDKINKSNIKIDGLIGSNLDPGEFFEDNDCQNCIRGLKVRGVFDTYKEAQIRSKVLLRCFANTN